MIGKKLRPSDRALSRSARVSSHSPTSTFTMIAAGTASSTPTIPASLAATRMAMMTAIGLRPVPSAMMRGTSRWFSSCWITT